MSLYSVLFFHSKVSTRCFKMEKRENKLNYAYMMSQLANVVREVKKISPKLSHSLIIYSFAACRPDISAESSQEIKNKNCKLDETKEKTMKNTMLQQQRLQLSKKLIIHHRPKSKLLKTSIK